MVQALGIMLIALFRLPEQGEDPVHWTPSRMNGIELLLSLLLFAGYRYRSDKRLIAAAVLVALTFALYQFVSGQALDGILQRLCILETTCCSGCFPSSHCARSHAVLHPRCAFMSIRRPQTSAGRDAWATDLSNE